MFEDARQHQRAVYYYKQAILLGCQTANADLDYNVDSVLVGIAEAYDGEWQDTGTSPLQPCLGSNIWELFCRNGRYGCTTSLMEPHHQLGGSARHSAAKYTGCS